MDLLVKKLNLNFFSHVTPLEQNSSPGKTQGLFEYLLTLQQKGGGDHVLPHYKS